MDMNRLTQKSQEALHDAQTIAMRFGHTEVDGEHLLLALLRQADGLAPRLLSQAGADPASLEAELESHLERRPRVSGPGAEPGQVFVTQRLSRLLDAADREAKRLKDEYVSVEHLVLALVDEGPQSTSGRLLRDSGLTRDRFLEALTAIRGNQRVTSAMPEVAYEALEKYGRDLVADAAAGKLDPVIGRDAEIRRVVQILSRKTKNNPVLIGEPGVGKTAIAEGLAQRITDGDVPEGLRDRIVFALDMASLVAGAKYKGEFEERFKAVLNEVTASEGHILLFVDELHNVVGAGGGEGAMDAGNMLKPALARGELHCVGATTLNEYRQFIEKDAALERRFQKVLVEEPSEEDTIAILRGLKERYEVHHKVAITDGAIIAAAKLSHRYITDRQLPDKAIDLIDEAASRIRMEIDSKPEVLDRLDRRLIQLKVESQALKKEEDEAAKKRLEKLTEEIDRLEREYADLEEIWASEKAEVQGSAQIQQKIEQARQELETARRKGDLSRMAELQYGVIPDLERSLQMVDQHGKTENQLLRNKVTEEEIAEVVSKWTGIPVAKMLEGEREKLLKMEELLHQRVIGQGEAVTAVANAVRRSRAGLSDPNRPSGSFLFLGPTGVGKTELCKALAEFLFDTEEAMVRIDMSEFMEKHSVARLIGAPPGYVGYEEGGYLTEAVRRKPYSVVLLDEVEKAHPDVFNVLLQVLEDGRLTDSHGRTVDFRNTVIVMTSNLGSAQIQELVGDREAQRAAVMDAVVSHFRPEFINRIDEVVVFEPLGRDQIAGITEIQLGRLRSRLLERELSLSLSPEALDKLIAVGYDPVYGARPLKRAIQRWIENPLAQLILSGKFLPGTAITARVEGEEIVFA